MASGRFLDELVEELTQAITAQFVIVNAAEVKRNTHYFTTTSTTPRPIGLVGDEMWEVDTGNYFTYYGDRWHLKSQGTYSPIVFVLTFDQGGASAVSPATKNVTYDSTYGTLATTTYVGYTLAGWFFDEALTNEVDAADTVLIEAATTVYPKFTPIIYPIAYVLDDGINDESNPDGYTIETATIVLAPATKDLYTFLGWYSEAEFTNVVTEIPLGSTGDITLFAKWVIA